jgi:hypothetical protein
MALKLVKYGAKMPLQKRASRSASTRKEESTSKRCLITSTNPENALFSQCWMRFLNGANPAHGRCVIRLRSAGDGQFFILDLGFICHWR